MDCLVSDPYGSDAILETDYLQISYAVYYKNILQTSTATPQKFVLNELYCGLGNQN